MRSFYLVGASLTVPLFLACGATPPIGGAGTGGQGGSNGNAFCAVKDVLQTKCTSCHSNPPNSGAPMPLMTYADTQAVRNGTPVWQLIKNRVAANTMPPSYAQQLTASDKTTIAGWNGSGSDTCGGGAGGSGGAPDTSNPYDPGCIGENCLPCTMTHRFKAHAGGSTAKYTVAAGTIDDYRCFTFKNPFYGTNTQVTAETPLVPMGGNIAIHHWLLFGSNRPPGADGSVSGSGCVGPELSDKLLSGWAMGGTAYVLPDDIGLSINEYPYLVLQNHYNNPGLLPVDDDSGVGYCTTPTPRTNTSVIVTLGTDVITIPGGANNVMGGQGTCGPNVGGTGLAKAGQSVYLIGSSPHMHKLGSGFTTTHTRNGQPLPDISNIPMGTWKFDGQKKYLQPRVEIKPGDQLQTSCYYSNPGFLPVGFGIGTTSEMCYDFVMVYPKERTRRECGQGITFDNQ